MLNDIHIRRLDDFVNPEIIFPNTNIRGGICFFLRDLSYDNTQENVRIVTHGRTDIISDTMRPFKIDGVDTFIRDDKAIMILEKIRS